MKRRLCQFGDQLSDLFIFPNLENEDDWSDNVNQNLSPLQFADGSYRVAGFDQSLKAQKTITKRFVLFDGNYQKLFNAYKINQNEPVNQNAFLTGLTDYMYRGLRGGVKRLYALMEDGTIRWTWAEANTIPYSDSYANPSSWLTMSVDFIAPDPYWYEVRDGCTFWMSNIPFTDIVDPFVNESAITNYFTNYFDANIIGYNFNNLFLGCNYSGVIIRDPNLVNYTASCITLTPLQTQLGIYADNCYADNCYPDAPINGSGGILPFGSTGCYPDGRVADGRVAG